MIDWGVLSPVIAFLRWIFPTGSSRNTERDKAASEMRKVLLAHRAALDPIRKADIDGTPMTHTVVLASISDIRAVADIYRPFTKSGLDRDRFNAAIDEFVAYAEERFWHREGGPLSYFATEIPLEDYRSGNLQDGAARHEAELRTEAIGHYERLLDLVPP